MSNWWIPRTVEELERAVADQTVTETHYLDFKAFTDDGRVSGPTVAKSIASLAVDGGPL